MSRHGGVVPSSYLVRPEWAAPPESGRHRRAVSRSVTHPGRWLAAGSVLLAALLAASGQSSLATLSELPASTILRVSTVLPASPHFVLDVAPAKDN